MVLLLQLDQDDVSRCRHLRNFSHCFRDTAQRLWLTIKGARMISRESNLPFPIAIELLRAVFSLIGALKENLLAFITGRSGIACLSGY